MIIGFNVFSFDVAGDVAAPSPDCGLYIHLEPASASRDARAPGG